MRSSPRPRAAGSPAHIPDSLQTIGVFAAAVGLSPSALRQYGERGLLPPTEIEEGSGYRYYAPEQQQRAIWIRRLRDAGLRLDSVQAVLDGDDDEANAVLDGWIADVQDRSSVVLELANDLRTSIQGRATSNPRHRTSVWMDAAILCAAIRQVSSAAHADEVLIETRSDSASIVATDRYILAARTHVPASVIGVPSRVTLVPSTVLEWLPVRRQVELVVELPIGRDLRGRQSHALLRDENGGEIELAVTPDLFPDARQVIAAAESNSKRITFHRDELLAISSERDTDVSLRHRDNAAYASAGGRSAQGHASHPFATIAISATALRSIVASSVGDELTCDVGAPGRPLLWRAPSQPDFVALMMPTTI